MSKSDEEYLDLLGIGNYVVGGITALFSLFPLLHVGIGIMMLTGGMHSDSGEAPPAWFGLFFILFAGLFILVGEALAFALIMAGRYIRQRRRHTFCLVASAIACVFFPFGTIIGVLSLILLTKPDIKALFE